MFTTEIVSKHTYRFNPRTAHTHKNRFCSTRLESKVCSWYSSLELSSVFRRNRCVFNALRHHLSEGIQKHCHNCGFLILVWCWKMCTFSIATESLYIFYDCFPAVCFIEHLSSLPENWTCVRRLLVDPPLFPWYRVIIQLSFFSLFRLSWLSSPTPVISSRCIPFACYFCYRIWRDRRSSGESFVQTGRGVGRPPGLILTPFSFLMLCLDVCMCDHCKSVALWSCDCVATDRVWIASRRDFCVCEFLSTPARFFRSEISLRAKSIE